MAIDRNAAQTRPAPLLFAGLSGLFLAVALLKFGNPVILDSAVATPENLLEALLQSWQVQWGYLLFLPVLLVGLLTAVSKKSGPSPATPPASAEKFKTALLLLPLVWLGWQFLSGTQTVDTNLTRATLKHFVVCVSCFYLGYFGLKQVRDPWPLWLFLTLALIWILREGFVQHFGGLEETRRYFYQLPNWREAHPDFIKKIQSDRIFSTLFYPNTLAGVLLLVLPGSLVFVWQKSGRFPLLFRGFIVGVIGLAGLACLFWSGSKAGWLVFMVLAGVALWHSPLPGRKWLILGLLAVGLVGFALRYAQFFARGSTSVAARFDYWQAAWQTAKTHPFLGTGPGTFSIPYKTLKAPEAEMARLTHNDYLEQASDSGFLGALTYLALISGLLLALYRYRSSSFSGFELQDFATWLGVLGVALHSWVEFHLYIPALAWLFFLLLGYLLSRKAQSARF